MIDPTEPLRSIALVREEHPLQRWKLDVACHSPESRQMWSEHETQTHRAWDQAAQQRFRLIRQLDRELWVGLHHTKHKANDLTTLDREQTKAPLLGEYKPAFCRSYWTPLIGAALLLRALECGDHTGWMLHLHDDLQKSYISFGNDPRTLHPFRYAKEVVFHGSKCAAFEATRRTLASRTPPCTADYFVPWVHAWQNSSK